MVEHAVDFCLSNKTYSMKDLADTYRFYKSWTDDDNEQQDEEELESVSRTSQRTKQSINVARRDLDEYTALLTSSTGELS